MKPSLDLAVEIKKTKIICYIMFKFSNFTL
jgi:hypothetical protein